MPIKHAYLAGKQLYSQLEHFSETLPTIHEYRVMRQKNQEFVDWCEKASEEKVAKKLTGAMDILQKNNHELLADIGDNILVQAKHDPAVRQALIADMRSIVEITRKETLNFPVATTWWWRKGEADQLLAMLTRETSIAEIFQQITQSAEKNTPFAQAFKTNIQDSAMSVFCDVFGPNVLEKLDEQFNSHNVRVRVC